MKHLFSGRITRLKLHRSLFNSCGTEPDFVPFYLAKAELFRDDSATAGAALERAYKLDPSFWRTGIKLTQYYVQEKQLG